MRVILRVQPNMLSLSVSSSLIIIIINYLLPPLCRVFTVISMKQTMFLQCIELQLYCTEQFVILYYYYYYYY